MDMLTRNDLITLAEAHGDWCVSLYMPTVRAGAETQQNPIRFKNLLRTAEERLTASGMRKPDAANLLKPASALLNDADLWRHMSDGLAVYVKEDDLYYYRVPIAFDELAVVTHRFHLKPLMPMLSNDGQFYVLAISQDEIRLLEGTRDYVTEVDLEGVPESLAEALQYDDPEQHLQYRMAASSAPGPSGGAVFHGHGVGNEEETKKDILRYFQKVDRGLNDLLENHKIPLLLAGVDYLLPIYREANTYSTLVDDGIIGNPETLSAKDLHQKAWAIMKPRFEAEQKQQHDLYLQLTGQESQQATSDLKTILQAAYEGRIATLFVASGAHEWGIFKPSNYKLHVHPQRQPDDQDLYDQAAIQTVINGGQVFVVNPDDVPGDGPLAAVFRY